MAVVTTRPVEFPNAAWVDVTFNDANGSISRVAWTVLTGRLIGFIHKDGQNDIPVNQTSSGSVNPPAGYNLVRNAKGIWAFTGDIYYDLSWHE